MDSFHSNVSAISINKSVDSEDMSTEDICADIDNEFIQIEN